jgi:23S rRNA pseudouridine2604 synthase
VVVKESVFVFRIVLIQGLNRQIRRMCEHLGYGVTKLERVRIMNVSLKGLPVGDWRELTEEEVKNIYQMVEDSSGTDPKSVSPPKQKTATPPKQKGAAAKVLVKFKAFPPGVYLSRREFNEKKRSQEAEDRNKKGSPAGRRKKRGKH